MAKQFYTLGEILAVARHHPLYNTNARYPLSPTEVLSVITAAQSNDNALQEYRINEKKDMYVNMVREIWYMIQAANHIELSFSVIERLAADDSPENTFRQSSYTSVTGGGWSRGIPMLFLTDSAENRRQRESIGALIEAVGIVQPTDWILNIHVSGYLYRSLDLLTDALEYAGGTILCAGGDMSAELVTKTLIQYRCNFLTGPVTELIKLSRHISGLPSDVRSQIRVAKILYTSEPLFQSQRDLLMGTFNYPLIYSGLGSAEAGFWAVSNPQLTEVEDAATAHDAADFIYDTRTMKVEILTQSSSDINSPLDQPVAEGSPGAIVLTSLQRLRNPLVRYNSGDIGSLHPLPAKGKIQITPDVSLHLRLLRIYGRDKQFSFNWGSNYFLYDTVHNVMLTKEFGILQWQIVLGWEEGLQGVEFMEVRILRECPSTAKESILPEDELVARIKFSFLVITNPYFRVVIVNDVNDFERSGTGRKVTRMVDRR
ncbi:uncharacterized protein N7446_010419 [Penicillium canescens]|uniref:Uncharacterized protein n=1 Tax=Penicillium canescens TaxID=5083 RepID=A0AAD6I8K0_PENCN|nr:uncharacterized protein N7446_010419 [Penicillium canescens]KAJ6035659.1 hypothetical protein N7460_009834 [Penicillium canescens]KAJ6037781.1 hypothetical protein N7444_010486 [Penicillium canescens]KAJ6054407.1 hypothetical protein N7446_010419 [Penicillium canescens]